LPLSRFRYSARSGTRPLRPRSLRPSVIPVLGRSRRSLGALALAATLALTWASSCARRLRPPGPVSRFLLFSPCPALGYSSTRPILPWPSSMFGSSGLDRSSDQPLWRSASQCWVFRGHPFLVETGPLHARPTPALDCSGLEHVTVFPLVCLFVCVSARQYPQVLPFLGARLLQCLSLRRSNTLVFCRSGTIQLWRLAVPALGRFGVRHSATVALGPSGG
jgi:hypothetical protein